MSIYAPSDPRRKQFVGSIRLDVRDMARIALYWRQTGRIFESRTDMIRTSLETFLSQNGVEEIDSVRAAEILADEFYNPSAKQKVIGDIVNRAHRRKSEQIMQVMDASEAVDKDKLLGDLPEEEVEGE